MFSYLNLFAPHLPPSVGVYVSVPFRFGSTRSFCLTKSNNFMQLKPFFIKNANFKCKTNSSHVKHQHSPPNQPLTTLHPPSVCTHASWLGSWAQVLNLMSPNKSTLFQHVPDTPPPFGHPCLGLEVAMQRA